MLKKENPKERMMETLSNAFISPNIRNVQEHTIFWAIEEGFNRTTYLKNDYRISHARKEHKCVRNCGIEIGDKYFAATYNWAGIKLCASCMAMILYFHRVWNLPTYQYDYRDDEKQRPHLDENSSHVKAIRGAIENS